MKKEKFNLVASILTALFAAFGFVGLAFTFVVKNYSIIGSTKITNFNFADWLNLLNRSQDFKSFNRSLNVWNFSRVVLILTLIVLVAVAVLAIIQLFFKNKYINLATKICAVVGIVLSVVFIICFVVGAANVSVVSSNINESYWPNVGPYWIAVAGILSSICALLSTKKSK